MDILAGYRTNSKFHCICLAPINRFFFINLLKSFQTVNKSLILTFKYEPQNLFLSLKPI